MELEFYNKLLRLAEGSITKQELWEWIEQIRLNDKKAVYKHLEKKMPKEKIKVGQKVIETMGLVQGRYATEAYNQTLSEIKQILKDELLGSNNDK